MPIDTSISHTIMSGEHNTPLLAIIDAIRLSKKKLDYDIQYIHIIFANIIKTGRKWQSVVSVIYEEDIDDDRSGAVVYGHLPNKHKDLYDDLLPHVDYLKLIDDDDIWKNIKVYLLNIYFYQAANLHQVERITETGGRYFEETKQKFDKEPDGEALSLDFDEDKEPALDTNGRLFNTSFYKATEQKEVKIIKEQDRVLRDALVATGKISTMIPILRPKGPIRN